MSEIKGQLLGMVLVLAIFGAIAGALVASFKKAADDVSKEVNVSTAQVVSANAFGIAL